MNIVAIGGGEIRQRETLKIDRFIRELSGKQAPKLLFLPTASYDADGYTETVTDVYGKELGCTVTTMKLIAETPSAAEIEDNILGADIVYVGGGDTKTMLEKWQDRSVGELLRQAAGCGTVLSGLSAGAVCWHSCGHSDYESFTDKPDWQYQLLPGLGFTEGAFCPHLDVEARLDNFRALLEQHNLSGVGCDNNAALWYRDDSLPTVVTSHPDATVKRITTENGASDILVFTHGDRITG